MTTERNARLSELEAFAYLEAEWEKAHRDIREAFLRREELGAQFWDQVNALTAKAEELGRALDIFRRDAYGKRLAAFADRTKGTDGGGQ